MGKVIQQCRIGKGGLLIELTGDTPSGCEVHKHGTACLTSARDFFCRPSLPNHGLRRGCTVTRAGGIDRARRVDLRVFPCTGLQAEHPDKPNGRGIHGQGHDVAEGDHPSPWAWQESNPSGTERHQNKRQCHADAHEAKDGQGLPSWKANGQAQ